MSLLITTEAVLFYLTPPLLMLKIKKKAHVKAVSAPGELLSVQLMSVDV